MMKLIRVASFFIAITGVSFIGTGHPAGSLLAQEEEFVREKEQSPPRSIGLSVEPGGLLIQQVKLGELYDLNEKAGITLKISSQGEKPRTYQLSTHRPSEVGNGKWLEGYLEIPDPAWFWFEQETVTVPAQGDAHVKMYLKIPEEDRYFNQQWVVSVGVKGKPEAGEMLALAAYPRYQIETVSRPDSELVPNGAVGFKPSVLSFEQVPLGRRQKAQVTLTNNEGQTQRYRLSIKTITVDPTREQIVPSPGYRWIPDSRWISVSKRRLRIKGGRSRSVPLRVKVPKDPQLQGQSWEALLWIEPDEGLTRFTRIQVTTAEVEKP